MNDDGQFGRTRQFHLADEYALLNIPRRVVVKIVEADFSPGDDFRALRKLGHFFEVGLLGELRFVRMNSNRGVNEIMLLGELHGAVESARALSNADGQNIRDPGFPGASNHLLAIRIEAWAV